MEIFSDKKRAEMSLKRYSPTRPCAEGVVLIYTGKAGFVEKWKKTL